MLNYYTVAEYAARLGKDPGNIRRLLINGVIEGEKMGRQWVIPKDTKYPDDKRIKNGEYKNWRKKVRVNRDNPILMKALSEMSAQIGIIYGNKLDRVILYGSYARGEQTPESDVDIAIIIKGGSTEKMHDRMIDLVVDYELDLAVTLSVVPIEFNNYIEWNKVLPYYKSIEREGIVLWKTA